MSMVTFSIRMDGDLKKQFEELCEEFGMNISTAFNIFARAVVREKSIPFKICSEQIEDSFNALKALKEIREKAYKDGLSNMSLDEINAEIDAARRERELKSK